MRATSPHVRSQGRNNFKGDSAESGRGKENINPNSTVNRGVGDEGLTKLTPYVADSVKGKENSTSASETPSSTKKAVVAQDTDLKQELSFKENLGEKRFNRYFLIMARKGKKGCSSIHKIDCGIERSFDEVVKDNFVAAMGSFIFSVMLNVKKSDLSSRVTPSTHVFSGELEAQFSAAGSVLVGEESAKRVGLYMAEFSSANQSSHASGFSASLPFFWCPSAGGFLKMNVDAAFNSSCGQVGIEIVVRNFVENDVKAWQLTHMAILA
ncbi:hypothetical protein ACOSP7_024902 [Xanthoceras sorbifolium]